VSDLPPEVVESLGRQQKLLDEQVGLFGSGWVVESCAGGRRSVKRIGEGAAAGLFKKRSQMTN
jgi:hypothetical protein